MRPTLAIGSPSERPSLAIGSPEPRLVASAARPSLALRSSSSSPKVVRRGLSLAVGSPPKVAGGAGARPGLALAAINSPPETHHARSGIKMLSAGRTKIAYVYNKPFTMANGEHFIQFLLRRGWTEGERLGAGATAAVFKIGESHIIKVVNLAHGDHSQFKHEVQMLKLLSEREHPMAMKIDAAAIIGPVGYILSPYIPGELLTTWLVAHEHPDERASVYNSILAAIREMHWARIIHRDIKPENIWVLPDLSVILLDFGIAARQGVRVPGAGTRKYRRGAHIPGDEEPEPNMNYFALGKIIEEFPPHGKFLVDGRRHVNLKAPGISRVAARFRSPNSSERRRRTRRRAATV